jgi:hypothetical protein
MFPAIEQGEQSIGYTRPKTRLAGDAGTVIANNPHDPPYPKWICFDGSFTVPTPHYRSRGDRGIFSRYSATSNISHIHLRPAAFPPPTNPNAQAPAHTALSQVQTQTWCSRWVLQGLRLTFRESPAVLSTRPCKNNFLHPSSVVCFFSNLTHTAKTWDCK